MKMFNSIFSLMIAVITMNGLMFGMFFTPEELKAAIDDALEDQKKSVDGVKNAHKDIDGKLKKMASDIEAGKESSIDKDDFQRYNEIAVKAEAKAKKATDALEDIAKKMATGAFGGGVAAKKSIGTIAAETAAALDYQGHKSRLATFEGSLFSKDITGLAASAGALVEPDRSMGIAAMPDQRLFIRDLLMTVSTSSDAIEWAQEKLFTNNAAPQAGQGAAKAKSDITFEKKNIPVQTIAHWFAASKQILSDAKGLRSMIEQRGRHGLKIKEEEQLLFGDGTGSNLDGLVPNATAYDVATHAKVGDKYIDQLRRSLLQVALNHYSATGFVLNPADWCDIELTKTDDNAYLFANPVNGAQPRLWGKPVVEGMAMTTGQFLTGDFLSAATLHDREQVTVSVSDSHANFFIENMVAILIEERLALTNERPLAMVKGTLANTTA